MLGEIEARAKQLLILDRDEKRLRNTRVRDCQGMFGVMEK